MKKAHVPFLILLSMICFASVFSFSRSQGFDNITHPDDVFAEKDESVSIIWIVTISTVGGNQTYNVFINGEKVVSDYPWIHDGTTGTIEVNPLTDTVGVFNVNITVYDGLGNSISDVVKVTVEEPPPSKNIWVYVIAGGVLAAIFLFMFFNRRRLARMIERKDNPI